jgi:hypothetical protein
MQVEAPQAPEPPTQNAKFSFEEHFSVELVSEVKSNGAIRLFERDTHVMTTLYGPKENIFYQSPDKLNCRIDVQIKTKLHLTKVNSQKALILPGKGRGSGIRAFTGSPTDYQDRRVPGLRSGVHCLYYLRRWKCKVYLPHFTVKIDDSQLMCDGAAGERRPNDLHDSRVRIRAFCSIKYRKWGKKWRSGNRGGR